MTMTAERSVLFVEGSPGPQAPAERVELTLQDGKPPRLLTDPTPHHHGDWVLASSTEDEFVYRRVARTTKAP